jgi:transposase InsO family protein
LVCIDYLALEPSGGYGNVLVITDHFSKFAQAIPTRNQTAQTTARVLFDHYIVRYGTPERIHSDQGRSFECKLIKELCAIMGIEKSRTSPYHPAGNGIAERFNKTLLDMIGTLPKEKKSAWKDNIATVVHAYNCTRLRIY